MCCFYGVTFLSWKQQTQLLMLRIRLVLVLAEWVKLCWKWVRVTLVRQVTVFCPFSHWWLPADIGWLLSCASCFSIIWIFTFALYFFQLIFSPAQVPAAYQWHSSIHHTLSLSQCLHYNCLLESLLPLLLTLSQKTASLHDFSLVSYCHQNWVSVLTLVYDPSLSAVSLSVSYRLHPGCYDRMGLLLAKSWPLHFDFSSLPTISLPH